MRYTLKIYRSRGRGGLPRKHPELGLKLSSTTGAEQVKHDIKALLTAALQTLIACCPNFSHFYLSARLDLMHL